MRLTREAHVLALSSAIAGAVSCSPRVFASAPIYGGPTFDIRTGTGYLDPAPPYPVGATVGNGVAVVSARRISGGTNFGARALRWDASGTAAAELGHVGTMSGGYTNAIANGVNSAGTAVGFAEKYSGVTILGQRAVRWDAASTAATELGNLGTSATGNSNAEANAINTAGTAVGSAQKYSGGMYRGWRAVRWDASVTNATELASLDPNGLPYADAFAYAINTAGTAVGTGQNFSRGPGWSAIRWAASGTAATELGNLITITNGDFPDDRAYAINAAGTAVGSARKSSNITNLGYRAVRWDAQGIAATELGNLGTDSSGHTYAGAYAINAAGTAVGFSRKYFVDDSFDYCAVRWDASGTAATELGNLGTDSSGHTDSGVYAISAGGTSVGYANRYSGNTNLGKRAVYWGIDGVAIDLNSLLSPEDAAIWTLTQSNSISDSGWITGIGEFDPDGPTGALPAYSRLFLMRVPPNCLADINGDTAVSTSDLTALLLQFGRPAPAGSPAARADLNADGVVNTSDLTILLLAFGESCP